MWVLEYMRMLPPNPRQSSLDLLQSILLVGMGGCGWLSDSFLTSILASAGAVEDVAFDPSAYGGQRAQSSGCLEHRGWSPSRTSSGYAPPFISRNDVCAGRIGQNIGKQRITLLSASFTGDNELIVSWRLWSTASERVVTHYFTSMARQSVRVHIAIHASHLLVRD